MEERSYSKKVEQSLSYIREHLKKAEVTETFYKTINVNGDSYNRVKAIKTQKQKELECLEQFTTLPEIYYYQYASDDKIRDLLEEKISELTDRISKLKDSIASDTYSINEMSNRQKNVIDEYSKALNDPSKKESVKKLLEQGSNYAKTIEETKHIKEKKEKDLEGLRYYYDTIVNMSNDEYRNFVINGIEGSRELLKTAKSIKANKESYKIFSRAAKSPERTEQLVTLLTNLRAYYLTKPEPVFYEKRYDLEGKLPDLLLKKVFSDNKTYNPNTGEIKDPEALYKALLEYVIKYNEQYAIYEEIERDSSYIIKTLDALSEYESACFKAPGHIVEYGNPNNTEEQNKALEFFTKNRMERMLELCNEGFDNHEADIISSKFYEYSDKIFITKKKRIEFIRSVVEGQIKIIKQKREFLKNKLKSITYVPVSKYFDYKACDNEFYNKLDNELAALNEKLNKLVKTIEGLVQQYNQNVEKCQSEVLRIVKKILELTGCSEYNLDLLIIKADRDDLISKIYDYSALYDAALLIEDLENEAKQVALSEEAKLNGKTVEEFALEKLSEQRDMYSRMLDEERAKNQITLKEESKPEDIVSKPVQIKTLKSKNSFLEGLEEYIKEDIDD